MSNHDIGISQLLIKGKNNYSNWSEPIELNLYVEEFFYKKTWFYITSIFIILGAIFIWVFRLMTERKRLSTLVQQRTAQIRNDKEVIEQQAIKLRKMDRAISTFFANISHELRTPLTVIDGMASQIETDPKKWTEKGTQLIKKKQHMFPLPKTT